MNTKIDASIDVDNNTCKSYSPSNIKVSVSVRRSNRANSSNFVRDQHKGEFFKHDSHVIAVSQRRQIMQPELEMQKQQDNDYVTLIEKSLNVDSFKRASQQEIMTKPFIRISEKQQQGFKFGSINLNKSKKGNSQNENSIHKNRTMFDFKFSSVDFQQMSDHYSKFEEGNALSLDNDSNQDFSNQETTIKSNV